MKRTKGLGDSTVRILKFRNALSSYAEFKLGQTPAPAASPHRLSMLGGDVIEVIERAKRMVADKLGVPVSDVRVSVDFNTPRGASAEPPFTLEQINEAQDYIDELEANQAGAKEGA